MSSEEPELPVAAYECRYVDWEAGHSILRQEEPDRDSVDVEHELLKVSDAEEAIKEARRQERQKILNKIDNLLKLEYKELENARERVGNPSKYQEGRVEQLEELRAMLKEEVDQA